MLTSSPCSCFRRRSSRRSPRARKRGSCRCLRSRSATRISISFDLLLGARRAEHGVEHVGVEHQRLQVIAHRLDVNVPVDEVDGLGAERMPEELAGSRRGLQRLVHLAQPAVVGFVRLQARVGGRSRPRGARGSCSRRRIGRVSRCPEGTPARRSVPRSR